MQAGHRRFRVLLEPINAELGDGYRLKGVYSQVRQIRQIRRVDLSVAWLHCHQNHRPHKQQSNPGLCYVRVCVQPFTVMAKPTKSEAAFVALQVRHVPALDWSYC